MTASRITFTVALTLRDPVTGDVFERTEFIEPFAFSDSEDDLDRQRRVTRALAAIGVDVARRIEDNATRLGGER